MCRSNKDEHRILGKRLNTNQGRKPHRKTGITTSVQKCKKCGLIFSNPLPVPFDIQDHYGIPPENYWVKDYFTVDENYFINVINEVKERITHTEIITSLDIGAGLGKGMIAMKNAGFDAYGFEPSEPFYERAISKMNVDPNRLKLAAIENVAYDAETFDFITFGAVLEHLYDPSESIRKALKWLKPGGIIHIEVPSSDWLTHKIVNLFYKMKGLDYVANLSPMHEPYHLYEFSLKSFEENGKLEGYTVLKSEYYVCDTFLPSFLNPIVRPYMRKTNKGMQLCVYLEKL